MIFAKGLRYGTVSLVCCFLCWERSNKNILSHLLTIEKRNSKMLYKKWKWDFTIWLYIYLNFFESCVCITFSKNEWVNELMNEWGYKKEDKGYEGLPIFWIYNNSSKDWKSGPRRGLAAFSSSFTQLCIFKKYFENNKTI